MAFINLEQEDSSFRINILQYSNLITLTAEQFSSFCTQVDGLKSQIFLKKSQKKMKYLDPVCTKMCGFLSTKKCQICKQKEVEKKLDIFPQSSTHKNSSEETIPSETYTSLENFIEK